MINAAPHLFPLKNHDLPGLGKDIPATILPEITQCAKNSDQRHDNNPKLLNKQYVTQGKEVFFHCRRGHCLVQVAEHYSGIS